MKVFISQPMNGRTDEEIRKQRELAINDCKAIFGPDVEEIDTLFNPPREQSSLWYLGMSIIRMADADLVYFCRDWERYRGCIIEHSCATYYNKSIAYEQ